MFTFRSEWSLRFDSWRLSRHNVINRVEFIINVFIIINSNWNVFKFFILECLSLLLTTKRSNFFLDSIELISIYRV